MPTRRFEAVAVMAGERRPVQVATRVLAVSESGYYAWRSRAPSARAIRHVWLTDLTRSVSATSRGPYGARRVHAELTLAKGLAVGHGPVELLMRRAGIQGVTGRPKWRRITPAGLAGDLVDRASSRDAPNQLWVTDIERHEALSNGVGVGDLHRRAVAAARL